MHIAHTQTHTHRHTHTHLLVFPRRLRHQRRIPATYFAISVCRHARDSCKLLFFSFPVLLATRRYLPRPRSPNMAPTNDVVSWIYIYTWLASLEAYIPLAIGRVLLLFRQSWDPRDIETRTEIFKTSLYTTAKSRKGVPLQHSSDRQPAHRDLSNSVLEPPFHPLRFPAPTLHAILSLGVSLPAPQRLPICWGRICTVECLTLPDTLPPRFIPLDSISSGASFLFSLRKHSRADSLLIRSQSLRYLLPF